MMRTIEDEIEAAARGVAPPPPLASAEIDDELLAHRGMKALFRHGEPARLDTAERKAFSFGNNGFIIAPQMAIRVLSCLVDTTDLSGLVHKISAGSMRIR
jgi:hypothetical protein